MTFAAPISGVMVVMMMVMMMMMMMLVNYQLSPIMLMMKMMKTIIDNDNDDYPHAQVSKRLQLSPLARPQAG